MNVLRPDRQEKLTRALATHARQRGAASMAIRLASDPGCWVVSVECEEAFAHPEPVPLFLAYSLTKSLIAATILTLCEEGRLHLSMAMSRWYPDLPQAATITILHVLNHTAGLPDYGRLPAYHAAIRHTPSRPWTFQKFAAQTYAQGLWFPPGCGWAYSNLGYMLLKDILERETGAPWQHALASRVLHPLGLVHTRVADTLDDLQDLVPAYSATVGADGLCHDIRRRYHPGWCAPGVVVSTTPAAGRSAAPAIPTSRNPTARSTLAGPGTPAHTGVPRSTRSASTSCCVTPSKHSAVSGSGCGPTCAISARSTPSSGLAASRRASCGKPRFCTMVTSASSYCIRSSTRSGQRAKPGLKSDS